MVRVPQAAGSGPGTAELDVAHPLFRAGRILGAVAVRVETVPEPQQQALVQLFEWGAAWLDLLLTREPRATSDTDPLPVDVLGVLSVALGHQRVEASATTAASEIARRLGCERVSIGLLHRGKVQVRALSHGVRFDPRSNLVRAL